MCILRIKNIEKSSLLVHIIEYFVYFCVKFACYALFCGGVVVKQAENKFFNNKNILLCN